MQADSVVALEGEYFLMFLAQTRQGGHGSP